MSRPDTGTRNNMIMQMAAAILNNKAEYCGLVAEQFEEKSDEQAATWRSRQHAFLVARDIIDDNAGCWS